MNNEIDFGNCIVQYKIGDGIWIYIGIAKNVKYIYKIGFWAWLKYKLKMFFRAYNSINI